MYKLLILFVFFSLASVAQIQTPVNNQNNSIEIEKKSLEEIKIKSLNVQEINSQVQTFELNVIELNSELKTISLSKNSKTPSSFQVQKLEARLKEIEKINNQSFEYHLLNYQVGNYDFSKIQSLKAAENLKPNDLTVLKELSAYSYISNDKAELKKYLMHLNTMRAFSKDLELYAINVLNSLPSNSVLITHGDQDTYPLLIQQKINNIRNDVEIISLDHLQSSDYRKRLKKEGFTLPNSTQINTQFFDEFMQMNKSKGIVVAASVPQPYLLKGKGEITNTGLGYTFGKNTKIDNVNLYEKSLNTKINQHLSISRNGQVLGNYLPFLFDVRNTYIEKNDLKAIVEIDKLITIIGQKSNKTEQVKALLNK